ncbi:Calreticulin-1 [Blyttiomyces sp. JEL0837]|nr:Calreticulin-1 [Blyttiomyces sp. JEL0837]
MNVKSILAALLLATPFVSATTYLKETFEGATIPKRWVQSESKDDYGKFAITAGKFFADEKASRGLQTSEDAKFYAAAAKLDKPFDNEGKDLVLQFTAKFEQNIDCGGGYIKLLPDFDPKTFNGDTQYSIMFGPDICGYDKKIHAILNYKGQNHLIKKKITPGSDQLTHQYTFILHPDQTYEILLDNKSEASGSILEDWDLLPPKTIKDPDAKKPDDWVDNATIADPDDVKPADWDDAPEFIVDPDASKPEDWDDEMDGDWEAPKISNPDFKGEWKAKQIPNPDYKGPWVHPEIANPEYVEDNEIYHYNSNYVGFDLWQVKSGTIFDNIIVTDSVEEAKKFSKQTFEKFQEAEKAAKEKLDEEEKAAAEKKAEEEKKAAEAAKAAEAESSFEEAGVEEEATEAEAPVVAADDVEEETAPKPADHDEL